MKLSAFKNNQLIDEVDLSGEIAGSEDGQRNFFIGRSDDCHLTIKDIGISREHIQITYEKGKWLIKKMADFGMVSLNGSLVNESEIKNGDMLAVGAFQIMVANENSTGVESDSSSVENNSENPSSSEAISADAEQSKEEQVKFDEMPEDNANDEQNPQNADEEQNIPDNEQKLEEVSADNPEGAQDEINNDEQINGDFNMDQNEGDPLAENPDNNFSDLPNEDNGEMNLVSTEDNAEDDNDKTGLFNTFVKYELELFGENAPYDKYLIEGDETFIGRDPQKCQVVLQDKDVSSMHAVIRYSRGLAVIEDLNSSNGTIYNGKRTNKASLANGDEFIIGSTTFTVKVQSDLLEQESDHLMPVESAQTDSMQLSDIGSVLSNDVSGN
ncbi:MAG: FHA domain-containing protein [Halobacteriovoraceae bacterium]|nr:FHA domain-containing protein [Halobacteriovoraceae bacterium]